MLAAAEHQKIAALQRIAGDPVRGNVTSPMFKPGEEILPNSPSLITGAVITSKLVV